MTGTSTQSTLKKATLIEVKLPPNQQPQPVPGGKQVPVQFNPQTLKLSYSNENKSANQPTGSAAQFVGAGTSKLAIELLFDTTAAGTDVRATTSHVAYFIKPSTSQGAQQSPQQKRVPPGLRFEWGTFRFDGVMDSLQETLDYFSEDGVPLRSTIALGISGIDTMLPPTATTGAPATRPQTQAPANSSLPKQAGIGGNSANWKSIATANNIDDPLHLSAGTSLDLTAGTSLSASAGAGASGGADAGFSAGLGGGVGFAAAGAGVSIGAGASAGASIGAGASAGLSGAVSSSANLGVGASTGVAASAGLGLSGGGGLAANGTAGGTAVGIGTRSNAAGSAGGSFGISAAASASVAVGG